MGKYVGQFLEGGAVFWAKKPAEIEVINDLDAFVANFYKVVSTDLSALMAMLDATVFGRQSHDEASTIRQRPAYFSDLQKAWAFFVLANSSMYSMLDGACLTDNKSVKAFYNKVKLLDATYLERFKNVFVEQRDALYVIAKSDGESSFFFVDPPYFNSDMGHYAGYSKEDYRALLEVLSGVSGKFILASYPSELLDEYVSQCGWTKRDIPMPLSAGSKGRRKVEVLVSNF